MTDATALAARGVAPSLAAARASPVLATAVLGVAAAALWLGGDIRVGILPFAAAAGVVLLAVCAQGLLLAHPDASRGFRIAIWWTTLAVAGPAGFFLAVGIGTLLGIDENGVSGWLAIPPMAAMAFGIVTTPVAMSLLAVGVHRAGVMPRRATVAVAVAGLAPPAMMVLGGLTEGMWENVAAVVTISLYVGCWVVIGQALPTIALSPTATPRTWS